MKFPKKIRTKMGMTYYRLSKELRKLGINISGTMLSQYELGKTKKMRLDVLLGYRKLGAISPDEFIDMLEVELGLK